MIYCVHRGYSKISILSEIELLCCLCKIISYNFTRLAIFYLKHLYSKAVDVSMMKRDWSMFFQFFLRWQFVILNTSQTSFMFMLYLVRAVKHPSNWAVFKLCVKKELNKGSLELTLVISCLLFYTDLERDYQKIKFWINFKT